MSEVWNMKMTCTLMSRKKSLLAMRNLTKLYGFIFFLLVSDLDFFLMKKKGKNNNTNKNGDKNGRDNMH